MAFDIGDVLKAKLTAKFDTGMKLAEQIVEDEGKDSAANRTTLKRDNLGNLFELRKEFDKAGLPEDDDFQVALRAIVKELQQQ